jgi:lysine-specific demethylase 8
VVLAGAAAKWGASSWTLDHLASVVGDISVPLFKSPTPVFHPEVNHSYDRMRVGVRFSDYVGMVKDGGAGDGYYYYLATTPFTEHYPELGKDVDFSYFLTNKKELHPNIWISMSGTVTPLHFDPFELHNFHAVVRGRKRFVLYEPEAGSFLAPYPSGGRIQHFSQVDLDNPDLRRFPDFPKAHGLECLLEEGDLLFLPMQWWHQVTTERTTISVNLWWSEKSLRRPWGSARSGRSRKKGAAGRGLPTA